MTSNFAVTTYKHHDIGRLDGATAEIYIYDNGNRGFMQGG